MTHRRFFEDDSELVVRDKISYLQQSVKEQQTNATAAAIQRMQFVLDNLHDMIVRLRSPKSRGREQLCSRDRQIKVAGPLFECGK